MEIKTNNEFVNAVVNHVSANKGQFGYEVVTLTEPRMNKRGNPYFGRVKKLTLTCNVLLGSSYEKQVNRRADADHKGEFIAEKPKGTHWVVPNVLLAKDTDENVFYLRMGYRKSTKVVVLYVLDNEIVTDENVLADIKAWIPKQAPSAKQMSVGVTEEDEVIVRSPLFENIIYVKQGDREFNQNKLPINVIKSLFL